MPRHIPVLLTLLAVSLTACGDGTDDASADPTPDRDPAMATPAVDPTDLAGTWAFERVRDRPVMDRSPAHIVFDGDGGVAGSASCNRMTGSYTVDGGTLALSPLAVTRRMCTTEALMDQETRVLAALTEVAGWRIEGGVLLLVDVAGDVLFRASRATEEPGGGTAH